MKVILIRLLLLLSFTAVGLSPAQAADTDWDFKLGLFGGFTTNNNSSPQTSFGILPPSPANPSANPGAANSLTGGLQVEWKFQPWLGFGLDAAGIVPLGGKVFDNTIGTFSPNVYAHLSKWPGDRLDTQKVDIYATGGYTALFQQFGANGFNVGGGVNLWRDVNGLMLEFRYLRELGTNAPVTGSPYYEVRVGWVHRWRW